MTELNPILGADMFTIAHVLSFRHKNYFDDAVTKMDSKYTDPQYPLEFPDFLEFVTNYALLPPKDKTYGYVNTSDPKVAIMIISPDNIPMLSVQGIFKYGRKMWNPHGDTITIQQAYILLEVFDTYMKVMGKLSPLKDVDETFFKRMIGDTYRTISNTIMPLGQPLLLDACNRGLSVDDALISPYEIIQDTFHDVLFRLFILRHIQYANVHYNKRTMDKNRIFPYYQLGHDTFLIEAISHYLSQPTANMDDRLRLLLSYASTKYSEHTPEEMLKTWFGDDPKTITKCLKICHMVYINVLDRLQSGRRMPTDILFLESLTADDCVIPNIISANGA